MAIATTQEIGKDTVNLQGVTKEKVVSAFANQGNKKAIEMQKNTPPLNTENLQPQKDAKITPPPTPVETAGLQGAIEGVDAYTEKLTAQREKAQKDLEQPRTDIQDMLAQLQGKTTLTAEQYAQKGGVDEKQFELNKYDQMLSVEQNALTRQKEKLQDNKEGMSDTQINNRIDEVERESLRKQADISIIRAGVAQDYATAKAIADRAVSAYMEKQDLILKTVMFNYEENKDLFDKAEQREFEALAQNRQNEITAEKENKKAIYDLGLQAQLDGAPASVIQSMFNAKTKEEALSIGSTYIGAQDRALKAEQIASAQRANRPTVSAPEIKNFGTTEAPIWKQYNASTGEWGDVTGVTSSAGVVTSKAQLQNNEALTLAKELLLSSAVGKKSAVGASVAKLVPFGTSMGLQPDRTAFESRVATLKSNLTLDNLKLLKGAMSDKDLLFLESIGSSLNTNMSETEFDKELNRIVSKLETAGATSAPIEGDKHVYDGVTYVIKDGKWVSE